MAALWNGNNNNNNNNNDNAIGNMDNQAAAGPQFPIEQWFFDMPPCTRWWTVATVAMSVLVQCQILSPFQLFYSFRSVYVKSEYWRLVTTFLYFGPLSFDLIFHIFFLQRYARLLEESHGSTVADFSWLLLYASASLILMSPFFSIPFLGTSLTSSLVYIWSRRNPETHLSFLGLFVFSAPYLPVVLTVFSLLVHGTVPKDEICGLIVGHVWYFFSDVYPSLYNGHRPLAPPLWWRRLFNGEDALVDPETERRHMAAMANTVNNVNINNNNNHINN